MLEDWFIEIWYWAKAQNLFGQPNVDTNATQTVIGPTRSNSIRSLHKHIVNEL